MSDSIQGYGQATILLKDGLAIIDFTVVITTAGSHESDFTYGINRDFLNATVGKVIQPITGGRLDYYDSNGVLQSGTGTVGGYGGTADASPISEFWTLARIYNTWSVGSTIKGTVYGTYSV